MRSIYSFNRAIQPVPPTSLPTLIIAILSLCLSVWFFIANRTQKRIDNLVTIHHFLHQDTLSAARLAVRDAQKGRVPLSPIDQDVRRVCSSFDFAGTLVRNDAVHKKLFLDYWRVPLLELGRCLAPIEDELTGNVPLKEYYKDFWWLIKEAQKEQQRKGTRSAFPDRSRGSPA